MGALLFVFEGEDVIDGFTGFIGVGGITLWTIMVLQSI